MRLKPPYAFLLFPSPPCMESAAEIVTVQNRKEIYDKYYRAQLPPALFLPVRAGKNTNVPNASGQHP